MFEGINVHQALLDQRRIAEEDLLRQAEALLKDEETNYRSMEERLSIEGNACDESIELLAERIFDIKDIRTLAIRYGLRFLPSRYYSEQLPQHAMSAVRALEMKYSVKLDGFHILAPQKAFELEDENADPLLFAKLADGRFLFIHKWGTDLEWYRALAQWPRRNPLTLLSCIAFLSLLTVMVAPERMFLIEGRVVDSNTMRMLGFFWMNIVFGAVMAYGWFAFRQRFSAEVWNARFE
jgi:hypothetical protein